MWARHEAPGVKAAPMTQPRLRRLTGIPRRPSLVGRDAELTALDEQVALARAGAFRVVLVTGEPGIGKSRLVNELAERQGDSAVVVGSRAFELGITYSLALWAEAFERLLSSAPTAEVRRLPDRPVLVLATARIADLARHAVAGQVLVGLEQDDALVRLELPALTDESVAALTRAVLGSGAVPPALVSWLAR